MLEAFYVTFIDQVLFLWAWLESRAYLLTVQSDGNFVVVEIKIVYRSPRGY